MLEVEAQAPARRQQARRALRRSAKSVAGRAFSRAWAPKSATREGPAGSLAGPAEKNFAPAPGLPRAAGEMIGAAAAAPFPGAESTFSSACGTISGRTASDALDRPGLFGGLRRLRPDRREYPRVVTQPPFHERGGRGQRPVAGDAGEFAVPLRRLLAPPPPDAAPVEQDMVRR